jgi:Phosphoribosyl-dephospho-CoA transferase MdcG.
LGSRSFPQFFNCGSSSQWLFRSKDTCRNSWTKTRTSIGSVCSQKNIKRIITPYDLVQGQAWKDVPDKRRALPAIKALPEIAEILKDYQWGISGSVGFELATKTNTAKMTSDLDLIWKPTNSLSKHVAQALLMSLNKFGVHADLQVMEGNNGFSLEEYANANSTVMMKTLSGPILVQDPWNIEE